jgi:hypothetical protein
MQHHIDGADPITYARMLSVAPSGEARHQFMVYGLNDTYTPSAVQTTYALAAGVQLAAHDASVTTAEEIGKLTETSLPASGNLTTNMKPVTAFTRQYGPAANEDGHFVGLSVASARGDAQRFLAGSLSGVVPQIGQ